MLKILFAIIIIFAGLFAWEILSMLSSDAISMALGILFGVIASIPAALGVLASRRRSDDRANVSVNNTTNNYLIVDISRERPIEERRREIRQMMNTYGRPKVYVGPNQWADTNVQEIMQWQDSRDERLNRLRWPNNPAYGLLDYNDKDDEGEGVGW